jgi:hypothetical protein
MTWWLVFQDIWSEVFTPCCKKVINLQKSLQVAVESTQRICVAWGLSWRPGGLDAVSKQSNGTMTHHKVNGVDNVTNFAALNGHDNPQGLSYIAHPMEPHDIDRPVRCPPPEPCIMHVSNIQNPAHPNSTQLSLNSQTCSSEIGIHPSRICLDLLAMQWTCQQIVINPCFSAGVFWSWFVLLWVNAEHHCKNYICNRLNKVK